MKNPALALRFAEMKAFERMLSRVSYRHVRREYNTAADASANEAMDEGMGEEIASLDFSECATVVLVYGSFFLCREE